MINKKVCDEFCEQIEMTKEKFRFDSYIDTINYILENNIYDTVPLTYASVGKFLNKTMKEKMLLEFSSRNCIKDKYKKKVSKVLF